MKVKLSKELREKLGKEEIDVQDGTGKIVFFTRGEKTIEAEIINNEVVEKI